MFDSPYRASEISKLKGDSTFSRGSPQIPANQTYLLHKSDSAEIFERRRNNFTPMKLAPINQAQQLPDQYQPYPGITYSPTVDSTPE